MIRKINVWCVFILILVSACAAPKTKSEALAYRSVNPQGTGWWKVLNDTELNNLVKKGREDAFDVRIAITQLDEAKAVLRSEKAALIPSVNLSLNLVDSLTGTGGFDLNWQLDLAGAIRNSIKAAEARAGSSQALITDTRRLITSQIVTTYIQLRARQEERKLAEKSAVRLEETVNNVTRLVNAGQATRLDQTRSTRQLAEINARIRTLKGTERAIKNGLSTIIGATIDNNSLSYNSANQNLLSINPKIPQPVAEDLFVDRPDIRAAALTLNAERYEKIAAERALYPTINLQGNAISNNVDLSSLQFGGISTSLVTGIVVPLIGRGRLLAQIDAENAQKERALINYERAVMIATTEIDTSHTQVLSSRAAADENKKAMKAASSALKQSRRLFEAGEINYLDVLIAEQSLIDVEQAAVLAEETAALAWVQYMTALALE